ncbi:MAG: hypothetical protein KDK30_05015 [Leptospiraceae bacterium]|nr:hypothetical protein [Leptospiraceae bacterium]
MNKWLNKTKASTLALSLLVIIIIAHYIFIVLKPDLTAASLFPVDFVYFYFDIDKKDIAIMATASEAIRDLRFLFWDPGFYGGRPFFANPESSIYYPLDWLLVVFNPRLQLLLSQIIHVLVMGTGMYSSSRFLRLRPLAALVSSIVLIFSGMGVNVVTWAVMLRSIAYMPWVLYFCLKVRESERRLLSILGLSASVGFAWLGGSPQMFIYILLNTGIILSVLFAADVRRRGFVATTGVISSLSIAAIVAAAIVMPQLLSALDFTSGSLRGNIGRLPLENFQIGIAASIGDILDLTRRPMTSPYPFYDGELFALHALMPFILPFLGMALFHRRMRLLNASLLISGIVFWLASLGESTPFYAIMHEITLGKFRGQSRIAILAAFNLALVTASGFQVWTILMRNRPHKRLLIYTPLLAAVSLVVLSPDVISGGLYLIYNVMLILALRLPAGNRNIWRLAAVLPITIYPFTAIDYVIAHPYRVNLTRELFAETLQNELADYRGRYHVISDPKNRAVCNKCFSMPGIRQLDEYTPLQPERQTRLFYRIITGNDPLKQVDHPAFVSPIVPLDFFDSNKFRSQLESDAYLRLLYLTSTEYVMIFSNYRTFRAARPFLSDEIEPSRMLMLESIMSEKEVIPIAPDSMDYELIYDRDFFFYRVKDVLPRMYLAPASIVLENDENQLNYLLDPSNDLTETIVLDRGQDFDSGSACGGHIEVIHDAEEIVEFRVKSEATCYFVLNDAYDDNWEAFLDDEPVEIYRANYLFRSIFLPRGQHRLLLRYSPREFYQGLWVGVILLVLASIVYLLLLKFFRPWK